jgi:acyl-CoA synthetase (NDP forming)
MAGTRKEVFSAVLNAMLASDHCDLVLAVAGSSAQFQPQFTIEPIVEAGRGDKPLAVFLAPHAEASLNLLAQSGIAAFRTAESCADAIRAWRDWRAPLDAPPANPARLEGAQSLIAGFGARPVNEYEACRVFAALGVPVAASAVMETADAVVDVPFPVAAKILSPDIAHKTEARGVALDIATPEQLRASAADLLARIRASCPTARVDGILVQSMERGLAEVIVGFRRDAQVGPVVMLGVGGVLAEIYRDFAIRLSPVGVDAARSMIDEVRGLAVIRGYRGLPRGDCVALARAVSAFSRLALVDSVLEAEVNPLIVKREGEGVVAVDGVLVLRERSGKES